MNEFIRIFSDRRRLAALFILPVMSLALFFSGLEGFEAGKTPDYDAYLDSVASQAERMSCSSVFGGDPGSFSYRNIQKTAEDFEKLRGVAAEPGENAAVESWVSFRAADWGFVLAVIIVVLAYFDEQKRGLSALIRATPRGRGALALSRLGTLFAASVVFTILFCVVPLAAAFSVFGGLDGLGRAAQSLSIFRTCTLRVTIGEWIALYLGAKVACGMLIGLVFWFVLSFLSHRELAWLVILAVFALEYAAYTLISSQMAVSILRYVNLFSYVFPSEAMSAYVNMNLFGYPVNALAFLAILLPEALIFLTVSIAALGMRRYPSGNRDVLGAVIENHNAFWDLFRTKMPLFAVEAYKLTILSGTAVFLLAGVYVASRLGYYGYAYKEEDSYIYEGYVAAVEGEIGPEIYAYLERAKGKAASGDYLRAIAKLESEIGAVVERAKDYTPWLLDNVKISNIYGEKLLPLHRRNAVIALAFLILCTAPTFTFEKTSGTETLLRGAPNGRGRTFWAKHKAVALEALILWAAFYGREWYLAAERIGFHVLTAPARNAEAFSDCPAFLSLGAALAGVYISMLFTMLAASALCVSASPHAKSREGAALLSAPVLILPFIPMKYAFIPLVIIAIQSLLTSYTKNER